jgi:hypothetical protein
MRTLAIAAVAVAGCMPPSSGAGALLHPMRRPLRTSPALAHRDVEAAHDDALGRARPNVEPWIEAAAETK